MHRLLYTLITPEGEKFRGRKERRSKEEEKAKREERGWGLRTKKNHGDIYDQTNNIRSALFDIDCTTVQLKFEHTYLQPQEAHEDRGEGA